MKVFLRKCYLCSALISDCSFLLRPLPENMRAFAQSRPPLQGRVGQGRAGQGILPEGVRIQAWGTRAETCPAPLGHGWRKRKHLIVCCGGFGAVRIFRKRRGA